MNAIGLPHEGLVRLPQILGDPKSGTPGVIPVSRSSWWEGVRTGRYPKPVRLGKRITAWRVSDIRALLESVEASTRTHEP